MTNPQKRGTSKCAVLSGIGAALLYVACGGVAFAQSSIGQMSNNAANDLKSVPLLIMVVAGIVGLILVIFGLIKFSREKHRGEDTAAGIRMVIVGVLLLSVTAIIGAVSVTSFGSNQTTTELNDLDTH